MIRVRNTVFGTTPLVVHSPGYTKDKPIWDELVAEFFTQPPQKLEVPDGLAIITWNNKRHPELLERSLNHLNVPLTVLGKSIKQWNNQVHKLSCTISFLEQTSADYVLGIDDFDAVVLGPPVTILERFLAMNCEMLFNATTGSEFSFEKIDKFCRERFPAPYYNLNAGAWIGRRDSCLRLFRQAQELAPSLKTMLTLIQIPGLRLKTKQARYLRSEQILVKLAMLKEYPGITIDHGCQIFQIINEPRLVPPELLPSQGVEIFETDPNLALDQVSTT